MATAAQKHISIYGALAANLLIAVTKFSAGTYTRSSSMIAEGIHSLVDTANQLLLLYGLKRSKKPADQERPFGYGKELYFWSFVVSISIFGLGGGISIYQGVLHIVTPVTMGDPGWNYAVLALSVLFEGTSFLIALREFNKVRGGVPLWRAIVKSKDPSTFLVLFEDGAAVTGLLMVFVLMVGSHRYNLPVLDGVASVFVGSLLVFSSVILARESRSLLMGEGFSPETRLKIRTLAEKDEAVIRVTNILSTYQAPDDVMLMLVIAFKQDLDTRDITEAIERIRKGVKQEFTLVHFVIIQPQTSSSIVPQIL